MSESPFYLEHTSCRSAPKPSSLELWHLAETATAFLLQHSVSGPSFMAFWECADSADEPLWHMPILLRRRVQAPSNQLASSRPFGDVGESIRPCTLETCRGTTCFHSENPYNISYICTYLPALYEPEQPEAHYPVRKAYILLTICDNTQSGTRIRSFGCQCHGSVV